MSEEENVLRCKQIYQNFYFIIRDILDRKLDYDGDCWFGYAINYVIDDNIYFEFRLYRKDSEYDLYLISMDDYFKFEFLVRKINNNLSLKLKRCVDLDYLKLGNDLLQDLLKLTENEILDLIKCSNRFENLKVFK